MKKSILAIELDDYILKIMQARSTSKGWCIDRFGVENIAGKSEDDLANAIKDLMHKLRIKRRNITLILPRSLATVRYLQLPTVSQIELKNMIDIQVVRQIPYTKDEMIYDHNIIGLTKDGYTKVLLVIVHRDIISKYLRIFEKIGIVLDSIELDSLAIVQLCKFISERGAKDKNVNQGFIMGFTDEKPIAVLDIDYANTNIVIIQGGVPTFTRAVSIGTMHLDGKNLPPVGKNWIDEWVGEINRSLTVFQREQAVSITNVITLGDYSNRFIPAITGKLSFPVTNFDFAPYIEGISIKEEKDRLSAGGIGISIASLLGTIREGTDTSVNLIPGEIINSRISKHKRKSLMVTGLLIAGIIGVSGLTLDKKTKDRKKYISLLENRLKETSPMAKELAIKKDRLALIKKQLSVSGSSLDILRELYSIIPEKTSLNVLIYDDTQDIASVTIKGASPAMSEVFDLIPKLENSPYFENVTSRYATQRKIKGQELTEFHIDCSIAVPQEEK